MTTTATGKRIGRPRGSEAKAKADVRALARQYSEVAVRQLARLALTAQSETARVMAIRELLDRGYGKPVQPTEGTLNVNIHDGARDRFRQKLDRIVNDEPEIEAPRIVN